MNIGKTQGQLLMYTYLPSKVSSICIKTAPVIEYPKTNSQQLILSTRTYIRKKKNALELSYQKKNYATFKYMWPFTRAFSFQGRGGETIFSLLNL